MSITELGRLTEAEHRILMILRCGGQDGHCWEGSPFAAELRCQARRLEERGLARITNRNRPDETAFITVKGLAVSVAAGAAAAELGAATRSIILPHEAQLS